MNARTLLLSVALCFGGAGLCFAQDPNIGTWKINEAKSQIPAGAMKITSTVYVTDGDNIRITQEGTDKDGSPIHMEWTGKFDGKDYPVTGNPAIDARSYKKTGDRALMIVNKKDGKVVSSARSMVSADGKMRTVQISQMDSAGKKLAGTAIYDKQ